MIIMKFGGSSLGSAENIRRVGEILRERDEPFLVVVSAIAGVTDMLHALAESSLKGDFHAGLEKLKRLHIGILKEILLLKNQSGAMISILRVFKQIEDICSGIHILEELSEKSLATILGMGELLSGNIVHKYLVQEGLQIELLDSRELIVASNGYLNAEADLHATELRVRKAVSVGKYVAPGFIASNARGEKVVLGRGGSDYSAAVFASTLDARLLEIWSDVNGMLNADPQVVQHAEPIEQLSYREAFELAYFGARVLFPPAVRPVMAKSIPVYLKNTLQPGQKGTVISGHPAVDEDKIKGVGFLKGISLVTVSGVGLAGTRGIARRVFQSMEEAQINVILISQGCSEQSICFGISGTETGRAVEALSRQFSAEMAQNLVNPVEVMEDLSIIAVVGDNMKHKVGLSGKIFGALGENGINVIAIAQGASERNISVVVDKADQVKAVNVVHERFFRKAVKRVHLFVAGNGNVGSQFLRIVRERQPILFRDYHVDLKIVGLANSKKMLTDPGGLAVDDPAALLSAGRDYGSFSEYVEAVRDLNLRNSVFIDNTASELVSDSYPLFLENSISVVTCNKTGISSSCEKYLRLKQVAGEKNCHIQYETSVGAALPVIKTIRDLLLSGDQVHRIEAVLSGSLNYIFNRYDTSLPFSDVLLSAMEEGYTEPDPRLDLSGMDVMRKILILAREAGYRKESGEVRYRSFLPQGASRSASVQEFIGMLRDQEEHFRQLYLGASKRGHKLKMLAVMDRGDLSVGLEEVAPGSPFFQPGGTDNTVAIHTGRYNPEPLVITGAGAGAEVTASGVFSDLMYIINR